MKKTAVVILNYNGEDHLRKFLPIVIANSSQCRIIVADNCSTDNSVPYIKTHHPEVEILQLPVNQGYSRGYNEALRQIDATYYVLLNSDVEVTENWMEPIIALMDKYPQIAAAQPKVLAYHDKSHFEYAGAGGGFIDALGYPFCRGRIFNSLEEDNDQYSDIKEIFWATGACMFVRSEVFHKLDGLDPDFFAHMEEIDLCWRINSAGYKVIYNGHSTVYHVGGGTLHKSNPRKTYLNFRNGLALIFKNYNTAELWLKFPVRIVLDVIAAFKFLLFDSVADCKAVLKAHWHFLKEIRKNYMKRKETQQKKVHTHYETIYSGSVVFEYFIKNKRRFNELDPKGW